MKVRKTMLQVFQLPGYNFFSAILLGHDLFFLNFSTGSWNISRSFSGSWNFWGQLYGSWNLLDQFTGSWNFSATLENPDRPGGDKYKCPLPKCCLRRSGVNQKYSSFHTIYKSNLKISQWLSYKRLYLKKYWKNLHRTIYIWNRPLVVICNIYHFPWSKQYFSKYNGSKALQFEITKSDLAYFICKPTIGCTSYSWYYVLL